MPRFLIIKLDGVMQGWGGHTYEDWRPTELFPTRSGLLGLLGACLGIDRHDTARLNALASSVRFSIRADNRERDNGEKILPLRLCDYHTILHARKVDGKPNDNPVQSYRWYLFDSPFTVAIEEVAGCTITLEEIAVKLAKPVYTPFLGRRSCPLSSPLLVPGATEPFEAMTVKDAFDRSGLGGQVVYSESPDFTSDQKLRMRDVPLYGRTRRFTTREVFIHVNKEARHVL